MFAHWGESKDPTTPSQQLMANNSGLEGVMLTGHAFAVETGIVVDTKVGVGLGLRTDEYGGGSKDSANAV